MSDHAADIKQGLVAGFGDHFACSCSSCEKVRARITSLDDLVAELGIFREQAYNQQAAAIKQAKRAEAAEAENERLREAATAYLQRHQEMKGSVCTSADFFLLAQAEDNLRAALSREEGT